MSSSSSRWAGGETGNKTIAIVGSGVVGTTTGAGFLAKGYRVVFCDVSLERVALLRKRGFHAVDAAGLAHVHPNAYLISVPSPMHRDGGVDLSFVGSAAQAVGRAMLEHPGRPLVVVRSTVPPATTEDLVVPALAFSSGREAGRDFGVCMNPEFLRAESADEDFLRPRLIVIGALDHESDLALREIYAPWPGTPILSMSLRDAEATKYVANLFNASKISFFNEMHRVLLAVGADPDRAFAAAAIGAEGLWNPLYGTRGGRPFGGACLPKDTRGFLGFAQGRGMADLMPMLKATIRVNHEMAAWVDDEKTRLQQMAQPEDESAAGPVAAAS